MYMFTEVHTCIEECLEGYSSKYYQRLPLGHDIPSNVCLGKEFFVKLKYSTVVCIIVNNEGK